MYHQEFELLKEKLLTLVSEHESLKEEVKYLRNENKSLLLQLDKPNSDSIGFLNQEKIVNIATNVAIEGVDTSALKDQIDAFIQEIDKCIAHLSRTNT